MCVGEPDHISPPDIVLVSCGPFARDYWTHARDHSPPCGVLQNESRGLPCIFEASTYLILGTQSSGVLQPTTRITLRQKEGMFVILKEFGMRQTDLLHEKWVSLSCQGSP
jgi:hypothetical protein